MSKYDDVDMEKCQKYADQLEQYLDVFKNYIIVSGDTEKDKKENIKTVKKLIKKLRKGDIEDVVKPEYIDQFLDSGLE